MGSAEMLSLGAKRTKLAVKVIITRAKHVQVIRWRAKAAVSVSLGGFEEDWGEMRLERRARQIIDRYNH